MKTCKHPFLKRLPDGSLTCIDCGTEPKKEELRWSAKKEAAHIAHCKLWK